MPGQATDIRSLRLIRDERDFSATLCLCKMSGADLLAEQSARPFLHQDELDIFNRLPASPRRESYLMGRYSAKQAVMQRLHSGYPEKILVEAGVFHQPVLRHAGNGGLQLSLSHCSGLGAALLFDETHPMGIDLECPDAGKVSVIAPHLNEAEASLIRQIRPGDPAWAHTWIWTAKEALGKVLRTGLTISMPLLEVNRLREEDGILIAEYTHFPQYKVMSFAWDAAIVSIALPRRTTLQMHAHDISPNAIPAKVPISSAW